MLTAREYLESVQDATRQQRYLVWRLEAAQARCDGLSGLDYENMAMPRSPNANDDAIMNMVVTYQDTAEKLAEQIAFTDMLVNRALDMFEHMREDGCPKDYIDELEMYYIWDMKNDEIAEKTGRTVSRVKHRRGEVLKVIDGYVPSDVA